MADISILCGDITRLEVDALVNAANETLLGGGGVDGAIHRAAGPELLEACRALPEVRPGVRCPVGEARVTPAGALPARRIIHVVGPVWRGGEEGEDAALERCYRGALRLARGEALRSIAFPAISCGAYGFPVARAAGIATRTVIDELESMSEPPRVILVAFGDEVRRALESALADHRGA